jgi:hypothetical protein
MIQVITKAVGTAVREVVIKEATRAVTSPANPTSRAAVIQVSSGWRNIGQGGGNQGGNLTTPGKPDKPRRRW